MTEPNVSVNPLAVILAIVVAMISSFYLFRSIYKDLRADIVADIRDEPSPPAPTAHTDPPPAPAPPAHADPPPAVVATEPSPAPAHAPAPFALTDPPGVGPEDDHAGPAGRGECPTCPGHILPEVVDRDVPIPPRRPSAAELSRRATEGGADPMSISDNSGGYGKQM